MANLKRNVFLSLAAVITSMSTISMNVAASQDQTQPVMPLEEDEYLVLTIGESHYSWLGGDLVLCWMLPERKLQDYLDMD